MATAGDKRIVRELAQRIAEIAALPEQQAKINQWRRHNRLQQGRPMILVMLDSAYQPVGDEALLCTDDLLRSVERQLRTLLHRHEHLKDDWPIEANVWVPLAWNDSGWGFQPRQVHPDTANGAYATEPVIVEEADLRKMRWPQVTVDRDRSEREVAAVREIVGNLLNVRVMGVYRPPGNPAGIFATMRGLHQTLLDMYDRPQWLHRVLQFMTAGYLQRSEQMEKLGILTPNHDNAGSWVGSGGLGYTDELPAPDYGGGYPRRQDVWGRADAQEFHNVAPDMYWEFSMQYQARILERFGLAVFGCCEAMDGKYRFLQRIPNIRRVSVSPWANIEEAAESLQDRYVFSWKMNPGEVLGAFDADRIRRYLQHGLEVASHCRVEIILNGIHTVFGRPERISDWIGIARSVVDGMG